MKTHRHSASNCPCCFHIIDAVSSEHREQPEPGDGTVCGYCGEMMVFNDAMKLIKAERVQIGDALYSELLMLQALVRKQLLDRVNRGDLPEQ